MKRLTLLLLLLAAPAHAATLLVNMESPVWDPSIDLHVGTRSGSGITAVFGPGWNIVRDADAGGPNNPRWGWIANEPSGQQAAGLFEELGTSEDNRITFTSGNVRYVSLWYTTDCIGAPSGASLTAYSGSFPPILDSALLPGHGYNGNGLSTPNCAQYETCSGDPSGQYCRWRKVTVQSQTPIYYVQLQLGPGYFWIDDVEFRDAVPPPPCPVPPCEFERARLVRGEHATGARRASWGELKLRYRP